MKKAGKLKVLIATGIYPPDIGGPATYSKLLFEELPQHEISVNVVSFGSVRRLPKIVRHMAYFGLVAYRGIKVDVVFAQDPVSVGLPALMAAKLLRKRFILKVVGDYAWEQGVLRFGIGDSLDSFSRVKRGYPFFVRLLKFVQTFVARRSEKIIVPSEYLKTVLSNWGISKKQISVIYNAFEVPDNIANRDVLRQLMQLNNKVIISVGRLVPWKGFKTLIEIMPQLVGEFPNITLFIVGSGPQEKILEDLIEHHNLQNHVRLVGQLDHETLMRYLKASDLFVLNTFYEGFSHQLLECMALEVPIVTTEVGGNPELIEHKKNGLLVPFNDKTQLRKNISSALRDTTLSNKMVKNARSKVRQFNTEAMITQLLKILK